jgi:hypothetical protein
MDEEDSDLALALLNRFLRGQIEFTAPQHIRSEVPNAITVATRMIPKGRQQPRRSVAEGATAIADFLALPLSVADDALMTAAYETAQQYGCAFYDPSTSRWPSGSASA